MVKRKKFGKVIDGKIVWYSMNCNYLTESKLGEYLKVIFPGIDFIYNRRLLNSKILIRPDYQSEQLKLVVNFDGFQHYSDVSRCLSDEKLKAECCRLGYRLVRIPYFVQFDTQAIKSLFSKDMVFNQVYEHGFISKICLLPANYCELGLIQFKEDLETFNYLSGDILLSLSTKIKELGDIRLVVSPSLNKLVSEQK